MWYDTSAANNEEVPRTKRILLVLSINLSFFYFKWISGYSFNASSALWVPSAVHFSDIFCRWSKWPFVYRSLLHIIHFLSAWWDLYCKLCLLQLRKPKDWSEEETSGINETSPQYQPPPFLLRGQYSVIQSQIFKKGGGGVRKKMSVVGDLKSFCHRYLPGEGLLDFL